MHPRTGELYQVADDQDAERRGLVPVPADELERVRAMTLEQRVEWSKTRRGRRAAKAQARRGRRS